MMNTDRVLVTSGDDQLLRGLRAGLRRAGYEVETACSAMEAAVRMTSAPFAMVVLSVAEPLAALHGLLYQMARDRTQPQCILLAPRVEGHSPALAALYEEPCVFHHRWLPLDDVGELARDIGRAMELRTLKQQNAYLLTELRDAREELRGQADYVAQIERLASFGRQACGLGRDLRAALGTLVRRLDEARLSDERAVGAKGLASLWMAARQCEGLLERVLQTADTPQPAPRLVDVNEVVYDALESARPACEAQGIRVATAPAAGLTGVAGTAAELQQALSHVLENAVAAMPSGGRLLVETCQAARDLVAIRIGDTGVGISTDALPRVFEPFFTATPGGAGLGLTMARSIVREHGGSITVESREGRGTTVTIALPAAGPLSEAGDHADAVERHVIEEHGVEEAAGVSRRPELARH